MAGFDQPFGFYLDAAGGLAMLTLGVLVAQVRPRRLLNLALAAYAASLGLAVVCYHTAVVLGASEAWTLEPFGWLRIVSSAMLLVLGFVVDRALRRHPGLHPWRILALAVAVHVVTRISDIWLSGASVSQGSLRLELDWLRYGVQGIATQFVLLLAAVRAWQGAWRQPVEVTALLSLGVAAIPGLEAGRDATPLAAFWPWGVHFAILLVLMYFVAGVIWIAAVPRLGRPAVVAGLGGMLFPVLGAVAALPTSGPLRSFIYQGLYGVILVIAVAALTYAILRWQMFDIDVKLKWTLNRGTVAALFLAVFFVVAQVAQNFLSDRYGWGLGGAVAGLMLFAIAPIQRAAEGLADRAMPSVRPKDPAYVQRKKRETYRNAFATAWADGTLTAKDQRLLHEVREALGLPEADVVAIERDWARANAAAA